MSVIEPAEEERSDKVVARNKTQMTGIDRFVGIIRKQPIIILLEEEEIRFLTVEIEFSVAEYRLACCLRKDSFAARRQRIFVEAVCPTFLGNHQLIRTDLSADETTA